MQIFLKKRLAFWKTLWYYNEVVREHKFLSRFPGVAKFGIALEWGSRGPEFESQHSDQKGAVAECKSSAAAFLSLDKVYIHQVCGKLLDFFGIWA